MDEQINEQINGSIDRKKWMKQHFGELGVSIEKTIKIRTKRAGLHHEYWNWIWSWTICNNIREAKKSNADIESPWNYPWILIIKYGLDRTTTLIQKHTARQGKARQHFHYQQDPDVSQIQVDGLQTQISWKYSVQVRTQSVFFFFPSESKNQSQHAVLQYFTFVVVVLWTGIFNTFFIIIALICKFLYNQRNLINKPL